MPGASSTLAALCGTTRLDLAGSFALAAASRLHVVEHAKLVMRRVLPLGFMLVAQHLHVGQRLLAQHVLR
eukprot:CAMPEP_0115100080 /NCGR_PEP_ID=MMETSP0227-20121206/32298_1 /TAXON_ID=89957 /ORGANISM="Polarella glacialis, Strain CCMP 1383" /LENGTH=69 /DNA_ID=CAMNT_0002495321 /DNA_START=25 /DNA_END=230 /DNA_ORIENTATION=+